MLFALAAGSLTACAQAHREGLTNGRPDGSIILGDSPNGGQDSAGSGTADAAPHIDSPMGGGTQTLSQTTANNDTQVGIACSASDPITNATLYTRRNGYYRAFTLSDYGITGTFHVTGIDFIVSYAAQSPSLTIGVGTYSGTAGGATLTKSKIAITQSTTFTPSSTTTAVPVHVPIAADITGTLVVEIDQTVSGSSGTPYFFFIGANAAGESPPGYISSIDCNITDPTSMTQEAGSPADMVLTVTGST
jgi:hypothetical protein